MIDETAKLVLTSSMQKDKVTVASSSETGYDYALSFTVESGYSPTNHQFTIEMDWGESIEDVEVTVTGAAQEETLEDFRTALMGKDGYLFIRPLFGVRGAITSGQVETTVSLISQILSGGSWSEYGLTGVDTESESWEVYETIDYSLPVPGRTYDFRLGCFNGSEMLASLVGAQRHFVPTAAPLNILTTDGQGDTTLNYTDMELMELERGSRVKFLKEVKYYSHSDQGTTETVKDDDESGIDYASDSNYTYILSVYVYAEDEEDTEISLNDIDELIGAPATGQPSTLFAAIAAGGSGGGSGELIDAITGSTSGVGGKSIKEVYEHIPSVPTDYAKEDTVRDDFIHNVILLAGSDVKAKFAGYYTDYTDSNEKYIKWSPIAGTDRDYIYTKWDYEVYPGSGSGEPSENMKVYIENGGVIQAWAYLISGFEGISAYSDAKIGKSTDTASGSATTIWGKINAIWNSLVAIVTTSPYAKEATSEALFSAIQHPDSIEIDHFGSTQTLPFDGFFLYQNIWYTRWKSGNTTRYVHGDVSTSSSLYIKSGEDMEEDEDNNISSVIYKSYALESQVKDDNDTVISVTKDVQGKVGTSSNTAAENGSTLFAVLKWVKDKIKDVYSALTDGTNGLSAIKTAVGNIPTTTPSTESQVNAARDKVMGGTGYGGTGKSVKDISDVLGTPASGHTVAGDAGNAATDAAAIKTAIGNKSNSAGEESTDTMFSWVKKLRDYLNGIVNTAPYAKESSVKTNVGGTDYTAIGELRDNNHGLSALLAKLAQIIADIGTIQTETEILSLPNAARIDIVTPEQSSGAISNLQIHANVMYHLGDLTALSLIMVEPSDLTIYNEFVVCFFCQTGFTLQITHWDANTQVLFNSGATCEAGHYYILSVVDNLALLAKF